LRPGMTGRPVFNTRSSIVDDDGTPVAVGEVGEVVVDGSTSGMIGYWHDEVQTSAVIRNGWIHTGDLARREADGFFTLVERRNFMIISGGENIYPSEVEKCWRGTLWCAKWRFLACRTRVLGKRCVRRWCWRVRCR
jgi:acyl-CoA synthetase (AMP-forming)/AMP-acid ligase II